MNAGEIRPITRSWNRNYEAASGTILELVCIFKEANRNFLKIFLFNKAG
jgi:hypothetical protein